MLLALVLACTATPADDTAAADDSGSPPVNAVFGDCDPDVNIPWPASADPIPAEPHAETFGTDAPDPYSVHLQWVSRDPSRSVAVLWNTDVDTLASQIQLGPTDGFPDNALQLDGFSFAYGSAEAGVGDQRVHELRVCGLLEPGTTYSYRVGGEGHWSPTYEFTTPGAPGSFDTLRFAIAGDSRGDYATWGELLEAVDGHNPDFMLFSGDMVDLGAVQAEWDDWFSAGQDFMARRAVVPAHGNHEFLAQHYFAQFAAPGNEEWFAIDIGPMLLMSLNDTVRESSDITDVQAAFIAAEAGGTDATWKVAMHHQTAYTVSTAHDSNMTVRNAWGPVFDQHGVQLVTAGHNHTYERSVPINAGQPVEPGEGTVFLTSGGAGAPLYTGVGSEWFNAVANPIEHYIIADVSPAGMDLVVRDLDGNVIDSFTILP